MVDYRPYRDDSEGVTEEAYWDGTQWLYSPQIGATQNQSATNQPYFFRLTVLSYGWPLRSMATGRWSISVRNAPNNTKHVYGFLMPVRDQQPSGVKQIIPYRPLPWGFLFNSMFFGIVVVVLLRMSRMPFSIRRHARTRRSRCPKCAYPFGDSPTCSECGMDLSRWVCETT
jgi:hypothetical protein